MVVAATVLSFYMLLLGLLGRSVFALTAPGKLLVFGPVWVLAGSLLASSVSLLRPRARVATLLSVTLFAGGVVLVAATVTLAFTVTGLFWTE